MGQGGETNEKMREVWQVDLQSKPVHGYGEREHGRRKPMERRLWGAADVDQAGANESC